MGVKSFPEFDETLNVNDSDILLLHDGEENKKVTFSDLKAYMKAYFDQIYDQHTKIKIDPYVSQGVRIADFTIGNSITALYSPLLKGDKGEPGDQGEPGDPFVFYDIYSSVSAMGEDINNIPLKSFLLIATEDPTSAENGRIYLRTSEDVSGFRYIGDMEGSTGIRGPRGPRGVQGEQGPKGEQGPAGTDALEVGVVLAYAGTTAPDGYLICDGSPVSRTDYANLFNAIGTTWGEGDGVSTFNIPDLQEVALVGAGTSTRSEGSHDAFALAEFKDDQIQTHTHTTGSTINVEPSHPGSSGYPSVMAANTTSATGDNTGRTGAVTRGKRMGINYIIKY